MASCLWSTLFPGPFARLALFHHTLPRSLTSSSASTTHGSPKPPRTPPLAPNTGSMRFFASPLVTHSHAAGEGFLGEDRQAEHLKWANGGGWVHRLANVDSTAIVEVGAVVHEHAQVGPHSCIGSGSIVGPHVIVGSSSILWYRISLQNCSIGDRCVIHNGVCVGQDGFGFLLDEKAQMVKKPQKLLVKIGNHVEIGANTCVDRGSWRDTIIGDHTKIDNLVQIGHNVVIGHSCMICGQVGLGGSSTLGDYVVLGGKAGVADHVSIASKVRVAAKSGVTRNITEPGDYAGFPAVHAKEWRKTIITLRKLARVSESNPRDGSES